MAIDFNKIFAQNGQIVELTDEQYLTGWGYLGSGATGQAPSFQTFNYYMKQTDQKLKILKDTSGQINLRKDSTTYALGDVVLSATLPSWAFAECTTAGTTGVGEPLWSSAVLDQTFTDGSCVWKIKDIKMAEKVNLSDFTQSLIANGWQKFPNNLMIQWGFIPQGAVGGNSSININFPTAFQTDCLSIALSGGVGRADTEAGGLVGFDVTNKTVSNFTLRNEYGGGNYPLYYIAIGG